MFGWDVIANRKKKILSEICHLYYSMHNGKRQPIKLQRDQCSAEHFIASIQNTWIATNETKRDYLLARIRCVKVTTKIQSTGSHCQFASCCLYWFHVTATMSGLGLYLSLTFRSFVSMQTQFSATFSRNRRHDNPPNPRQVSVVIRRSCPRQVSAVIKR